MIIPDRTAKTEYSTCGLNKSIAKYDFTINNENAKITDSKMTVVAFVRDETIFLSITAPL
jgi:hypothetical protein